jgi:hypothetical protein
MPITTDSSPAAENSTSFVYIIVIISAATVGVLIGGLLVAVALVRRCRSTSFSGESPQECISLGIKDWEFSRNKLQFEKELGKPITLHLSVLCVCMLHCCSQPFNFGNFYILLN